MKLPNFMTPFTDSSSKIGHDFSNKGVQKLKLSKNHFYKKCAPKQVFFNEKKNSQNTVVSFEYSWCFVKNLTFSGPSQLSRQKVNIY